MNYMSTTAQNQCVIVCYMCLYCHNSKSVYSMLTDSHFPVNSGLSCPDGTNIT